MSKTLDVRPVPVGYDAYTMWDRWPRIRFGARALMVSTREGGCGQRRRGAQQDARHEKLQSLKPAKHAGLPHVKIQVSLNGFRPAGINRCLL